MDTLYIVWKLEPYRTRDLQTPPPILQFIFLFSEGSFEAHTFLILIESNSSVFPFVAYAFDVPAKDCHQIQGHGNLLLGFLVRVLEFWHLGFMLSFLPSHSPWLMARRWGTTMLTLSMLLRGPPRGLNKVKFRKVDRWT